MGPPDRPGSRSHARKPGGEGRHLEQDTTRDASNPTPGAPDVPPVGTPTAESPAEIPPTAAPSAPEEVPGEFSPERTRLEALIDLLADATPSIRGAVEAELERLGPLAVPALRAAASGEDAQRRGRARTLLGTLERARTIDELVAYVSRPRLDLEEALLLLSRLERPDFDPNPYVKVLDGFARAIADRVAAEPDGPTRPMVLVDYLGREVGFEGVELDYHHPDNVFLHRAIETRSGLPLTLTAIYLFVARRLGIRAGALALPGHVLLRLHGGEETMIVDPFRGGALCTPGECLDYLARHGVAPRPSWFHDAPDRVIFQRQVRNLAVSWRMRGLDRRATDLDPLHEALDRAGEAPVTP